MSISIAAINVDAGESVIVKVAGSSEVCLAIIVTKDKRCFLTGPCNANGSTMELKESGLIRSTEAERDEAFKI